MVEDVSEPSSEPLWRLPGTLGQWTHRTAVGYWRGSTERLQAQLNLSPKQLLQEVLYPQDFPNLLNKQMGGELKGETLEVAVRAITPVLCFRPPLPPSPVTFGAGPGVSLPQLAAGALVSFGAADQGLKNLQGASSPLWDNAANPSAPPELTTHRGWGEWLKKAQQERLLPQTEGWKTLPRRLRTAQQWGLTPTALYALALDPKLLPPLLAYQLELAGLSRAYDCSPYDLQLAAPVGLPFGGPAPVVPTNQQLNRWLAKTQEAVEAEVRQELRSGNLRVAKPWRSGQPLPSLEKAETQRSLALNLRVTCDVLDRCLWALHPKLMSSPLVPAADSADSKEATPGRSPKPAAAAGSTGAWTAADLAKLFATPAPAPPTPELMAELKVEPAAESEPGKKLSRTEKRSAARQADKEAKQKKATQKKATQKKSPR